MKFLGTGAADTIPNPFCECPICEDAREDLINKTRKRSSLLIDDNNLIDFGPDIVCAAQIHNVKFTKLRNIFITHTHDDHFCYSNAGVVDTSRNHPEKPINIFISEKAFIWLKDFNEKNNKMYKENLFKLIPVTPYESFIVDNMEVLPIETTHFVSEKDEKSLNYRFILSNGKKILYACDTGVYEEKNLLTLSNCTLDYIIMELTFGNTKIKNDSHLYTQTFIKMLNNFIKYGIANKNTKVYATHINHKNDFNHEKLQQYLDEYSPIKVVVAKDGMEI